MCGTLAALSEGMSVSLRMRDRLHRLVEASLHLRRSFIVPSHPPVPEAGRLCLSVCPYPSLTPSPPLISFRTTPKHTRCNRHPRESKRLPAARILCSSLSTWLCYSPSTAEVTAVAVAWGAYTHHTTPPPPPSPCLHVLLQPCLKPQESHPQRLRVGATSSRARDPGPVRTQTPSASAAAAE